MPPIPLHFVVLATGLFIAAAAQAVEPTPPAGFRLEAVSEQSLGLWEGDKPVFVYNHGLIAKPEVTGGRKRACYFHPVFGLDGETLTDDFPKDHLYHRGMYWAWPHIKIGEQEYDLWSVKPELRQQFVRWLTQEANASSARLAVENGSASPATSNWCASRCRSKYTPRLLMDGRWMSR